jgi:DNA topoisomerase-2
MDEDKEILVQQIFEGSIIEPKYYVPIIPMLLVNGSVGLTTGFSQKILSRNPKDLIKWIQNKLENKSNKNIKFVPYFSSYTGTIENGDNELPNSWKIYGKYEKDSSYTIKITDIPCGSGTAGYDLKSYLAVLDKLIDDKKIKSYDDYSEGNKIEIKVTFWRNQGLNINECDIFSELKLCKCVTECFTALNENNQISEFKSIDEILEYYYNIRYSYYEKRKELLIKKLTDKIYLEASKYIFIKGVINEEIVLKNVSKKQIIDKLKDIKNIILYKNSYDYLLNMSLYSITREKYEELKIEIKKLKDEYSKLKSTTIEQMWLGDLINLQKVLK